MKQAKLSKRADLQIRLKLVQAMLKKHFRLGTGLQIALPTFVLCMLAVGIYANIGQVSSPSSQLSQNFMVVEDDQPSRMLSQIDEIRVDKYKQRAQKRSAYKKALRYKQYALIRSSKIRKNS